MEATILDPTDALPPIRMPSRAALWSGRVLSGFAVLFLTFDVTIKLLQLAPAVSGTTELGFSADLVLPLGLVELTCLVLYLVPRASVVGAVFFTGYLGGAIATHLRLDHPMISHVLFPIYVAAFLWGGLFLRDVRVRTLLGPAR